MATVKSPPNGKASASGTTPYRQGWNTLVARQGRESNPYEPGTQEAKDWERGYREADAADKRGEYVDRKSFDDWANCVRKARCGKVSQLAKLAATDRLERVYDSRYQVVEKAAMAETSGGVGGYLVPPELQLGLMRTVAERSIFWRHAFVAKMHSKTLNLPLPDPTGSIGTKQFTNVFGGMQLTWGKAENATLGETEPKFRNVELNANVLSGYLLISNQMMEDYGGIGGGTATEALEGVGNLGARVQGGKDRFLEDLSQADLAPDDPLWQFDRTMLLGPVPHGELAYGAPHYSLAGGGLGGYLTRLIGEAVAWSGDQAFFLGNGIGQPQGIVPPVNTPGAASGATILIDRTTANQVGTGDLAGMYSQLLPRSTGRAVWACSPGAAKQILAITSYAGLLYFLSGEERGKDAQGYLYGIPIKISEKLPDVGTIGDVVLFDPSCYAIGFRDLLIDFSDQEPTAWGKNQTVCRVVARLDGAPILQSTVTLANNSSTKVSPFICLR